MRLTFHGTPSQLRREPRTGREGRPRNVVGEGVTLPLRPVEGERRPERRADIRDRGKSYQKSRRGRM